MSAKQANTDNCALGTVSREALMLGAAPARQQNVIHLSAALSLRQHITSLERVAMISNQTQDQLLHIDLPLIAGLSAVPVLVLLIERNQQSCTVLLDDEGSPLTKILLGEEIPRFYNPRPFGSMRELFANNLDASNAIFAEEGLATPSLTAARALALMLKEPGLSAPQALARARAIGAACASMVVRQAAVLAEARAA